jgi:diphosphomevalonate decarboxylase
MTSPRRSCVRAHANIALAKYWGKLDDDRNLPSVPSLSLTLEGLSTVTEVTFDAALAADEVTLDGATATGRPRDRVVALLDRVRARSGCRWHARVRSRNDFPTAAGLASSASGFAALALAAARCLLPELTLAEVSGLARASSASAARSLFGGFVALAAGGEQATQVAPETHWPLVMLVAVTASGPKAISSTHGMRHTAHTSPYYPAWVEHAPILFEQVREAVLARDLPALGAAMEQSALAMHASMLAARPAVVYFSPGTLAALSAVRGLRDTGTPAYATMDAGPHVKVLTVPEHARSVEASLSALPDVQRVLRAAVGGDAREVAEGPD